MNNVSGLPSSSFAFFHDEISRARSLVEASNHLLAEGDPDQGMVAAQLMLLVQNKVTAIENFCTLIDQQKTTSPQLSPNDHPNIGSRIREIRKSRGITQKDIAELVGVTPSCVTQWESGLISPNCDKLIPLAKALGCDPLWLIGK